MWTKNPRGWRESKAAKKGIHDLAAESTLAVWEIGRYEGRNQNRYIPPAGAKTSSSPPPDQSGMRRRERNHGTEPAERNESTSEAILPKPQVNPVRASPLPKPA